MRHRLLLRGVVVLVLLGAVVGWRHHGRVESLRAGHWEEGRKRSVQEIELLLELPRILRESSGLARSLRNPGLFWTHNDSGGDAVIYGVRPGVGIVAELHLAGAPVRDWEDMDLGPCPPPTSGACLYVGDIGDNLGLRSHVSVLAVEEPLLAPDAPRAVLRGQWQQLDVAYPGGARDAEALVVWEDGTTMVVSKGREGTFEVYSLPPESWTEDREGPLTFRGAGVLPVSPLWWVGRVVTAGTDLEDQLVIRTYTEVYFFRPGGDGWEATRTPCFVADLGKGGEGLDVDERTTLYLTREAVGQRPAALERGRCPEV